MQLTAHLLLHILSLTSVYVKKGQVVILKRRFQGKAWTLSETIVKHSEQLFSITIIIVLKSSGSMFHFALLEPDQLGLETF